MTLLHKIDRVSNVSLARPAHISHYRENYTELADHRYPGDRPVNDNDRLPTIDNLDPRRSAARSAGPWTPCPCCDCYVCAIHGMHAHDCPCPPAEEWATDPYGAGPMTVAERLVRLLNDHDTNPNAVAAAGRLDRNAVYKIVRGENANPKLETLRAIVEAAGGTLGELFRDD